MKLKVTKDLCEIKENEIWNVGDYNVHTVQVELSPEFNGLVNKVRYFVEDNSYDMLITDNVAQVPYEATVTEGTIKIGVYGYDADTDILVQSTSPVNKYITSGTYTGDADNTQPLTPTDKEQMETAIQKNTNDITDLKANKQDKLISGINIKTINNESILSGGNLTLVTEETDPIFTNSPAYSITDNDITYWNNKANVSDIPDVSNFITKDVDNLTYYTKSTDMQNAIGSAVNTEKVARENADVNLQNQIDAITVSSDVVDVVSTYQDLVDYDTQHIKANDIIKVMQDSTHDNAISYYRWVIVNHVGSWVYVGSEGPYYTKSETDTLLNAKQNTITTTNKLQSDLVDDTNQTNLFVTSTEKTTWNNKLDQSDLTDYVKNTDYASSSTGGVIKTGSNVNVDNNGVIYADNQTYSDYSSSANTTFISKGTLENVITGKNLETANNKVTSISSSSTDVQYPSAKCVYDNDVIIKDDVNTKYDYLFSLTNLFGKITGTGTSITLNNTSDTMLKMELNGNTTQNTTTGKNLANFGTDTQLPLSNAVTIIDYGEDKTFTNLAVSFYFTNAIFTNGGGAILDFQKDDGTHNYRTGANFKNSNNVAMATNTTLNGQYYSIESNITFRKVIINTWINFTQGKMSCQIEEGSTATSYEQYTGGQPAPSPSYPQTIHTISGDNTIKVENKNLVFSQLDSKNIDYTGQIINQNGFNLNIARVVLGQTYTTSKVSELSNWDLVFAFYESEPSLGSQSYNSSRVVQSNNSTFTAPITGYVAFRSDSSISNIQLEKGLTSTTYVRHKEQAYPINLGDIEVCKIGDYQDYFYKNNGKWYLHKEIGKVILDENSTISVQEIISSNNKFIWRYTTTLNMAGSGSRANILSNYYIGDTGVYGANDKIGAYVNSANLTNFATLLSTIGATTSSTTSQVLKLLKTWLTSNNVTLYYPLATPTYTLLNDTLQTQLDNIQYALAYDTQTNISQTNNDLPFIINAETFAKIGG